MDDKSNILSYSVTSKIPSELQTSSNEIEISTIIALPNDTDKVTFNQGDTIKNAYAFNQYLAANVVSGTPLVMTKSQVMSMVKKLSMQLSNGGLDSLAMVCTDTECPRYHSCSIVQSGMPAPVGEQCPIEKAEVANHMKRLALDFDDLPSYADQLTVQGVVGCELLKARVYADMANNPDAVIEVGKGMDRQGNPIVDRVDNPNQKIWAQINKTEQTLLKSLHMTMEQKKKIEEGSKKKTPDAIRELYKERLRQLKEKNKLGDDIIDVDIKQGDLDEEVHSGKKYIVELEKLQPQEMEQVLEIRASQLKEMPEIAEKALSWWEERKIELSKLKKDEDGLENRILASLMNQEEMKEQETPSLEQMTIAWKRSSEEFSNAEEFPLPIINIHSDPLKESTTFICANTALKGKEIIQNSKVFQKMSEYPESLFELLFYYVNPVTNNIMGFYVDNIGQDFEYAINHGVYDLGLSSMPVLKFWVNKTIDTFEMG